ncbi:hypothetical protein ACFTRD_30475 [Paenibacillus sp. NPDC056933]|uniref:hypothetical protein n=1 Tax=Paenibacillus sp. NPDC056933 TaxID=3345968 RepID=UPI0036278A7F
MAEISAILLNAGASVTPAMKESVKRIGKDFEFFREKFNKDSVDEVSEALLQLYRLFDVEPVANRIMHVGTACNHLVQTAPRALGISHPASGPWCKRCRER